MLGAVLGGLSIASSLFGVDSGKDAGRLAARARRLRNRQSDLTAEKRVREFIRNAQQQRAAAIAEGTAMGAGITSSTVEGATAALGSLTNSELEFFSDFQTLENKAARLESAAQTEQNRANMFGGIADIFSTGASIFG